MAVGADAVVDLGDVRVDVLDARVVEAVDPQARVAALHLALEVVKGPCRVLQAEVEETLGRIIRERTELLPFLLPLQHSNILRSSVPLIFLCVYLCL